LIGLYRSRIPAALLLVLPTGAAAETPSALPTWTDLESRKAVIGEVVIVIEPLFDATRPEEDHALGRAANRLHASIRPEVVEQVLLFRRGDPVRARTIAESERLLRRQRYVKEARILAENRADGSVRAVVRVRDAWTLKAYGTFRRVGGQTSWSLRARDSNFLGFGKDLLVARETQPERTTATVGYEDPQLLGSRWIFGGRYQSLSDGKARSLRLERPFFSLETPWAFRFKAKEEEIRIATYNRTVETYGLRTRTRSGELSAGWALGPPAEDQVQRLEMGFSARDLVQGDLERLHPELMPEPNLQDRRQRTLFLRWTFLQDRHLGCRNLAAVNRQEDVNLGGSVMLALGWNLPGRGSGGILPEVAASKGWQPAADTLVLAQASAKSLRTEGTWQDGAFSASLVSYFQGLPRQTLAARIAADAVWNPEFGNLLYLGGEDGHRGYRNHLLAGDRRWSLTVEDRVFTDVIFLWGILQLGFVGYADLGAIRRLDGTGWSKPYPSLGGGFRMGDLKSSMGNIFYLTVAVPLLRDPANDRYQLNLSSVMTF
jgi:hypothetical protein